MTADDYEGALEIERAWREGLRPDPRLTVSEWAERYRIGTDLPDGAIERIYAIQKRHQFDADRSLSAQEMQRLIEILASESEGGSQ